MKAKMQLGWIAANNNRFVIHRYFLFDRNPSTHPLILVRDFILLYLYYT